MNKTNIMKVTAIVNGKVSLVLVPETKVEEEVLKTLNGGVKVQIIAQNVNILQNSVGGGLLITSEQNIDDLEHKKPPINPDK